MNGGLAAVLSPMVAGAGGEQCFPLFYFFCPFSPFFILFCQVRQLWDCSANWPALCQETTEGENARSKEYLFLLRWTKREHIRQLG